MSPNLALANDRPERSAHPRLSVWHTDRPWQSTQHALPVDGDLIVGNAEACNIRITDDSWVSRHHLKLTMRAGVGSFVDRRSTNGTLLNGKPSVRSELMDGDVLRIGDTCLQVHYPNVGRPTPKRGARPSGPADAKYDKVRAAVVRIYDANGGELIPFQRGHLDRLLGDALDTSERTARRKLNEFAKHLRVPTDVTRSARWQAVGDICAGKRR